MFAPHTAAQSSINGQGWLLQPCTRAADDVSELQMDDVPCVTPGWAYTMPTQRCASLCQLPFSPRRARSGPKDLSGLKTHSLNLGELSIKLHRMRSCKNRQKCKCMVTNLKLNQKKTDMHVKKSQINFGLVSVTLPSPVYS